MINFEFWIFKFDISSLIAFLVGVFFGFVILSLIYLILIVKSMRNKKANIKATIVSDEELNEIYENALLAFQDKSLRGSKAIIGHTYDLSIKMVNDIARKYFPNSKYPLAELSIDEALQLLTYISKRIDDILNKPALRLFKKVKISTIFSISSTKKKIDDSTLMKLTKKYKVKKVVSAVLGAINVLNPIYWVRKVFIDTSIDLAMKHLCKIILGIVFEETVKIYSKRVFEDEKLVDAHIGDLIKKIQEDTKDLKEEDIDNYMGQALIEGGNQDE